MLRSQFRVLFLSLSVGVYVTSLVLAAELGSDEAGNSKQLIQIPNSLAPELIRDPYTSFKDYQLGPGDILNLHTWGEKSVSVRMYVSSNDEIFIPLVGVIKTKDMKLGALQPIVERKLKSRYKPIECSIELSKPRQFRILLAGHVKEPGLKTASGLMRLHDFLTSSGGLSPTGTQIQIEIINQRTKKKTIVNYQDFLYLGDLKGNPILNDGDTINVPPQQNVVLIKGNVSRSGRVEFEEKSRLLKDVIETYLGGFIQPHGIKGKIAITRLVKANLETDYVDTNQFFDNDSPINYENFQLRNGDEIFFPSTVSENPVRAEDFIFVTGEVKVPGPQRYQPGKPVASYLAAAGGLSVRGNFDESMIYKAAGLSLPIGDNPSLEPGDTIHVPEKTFKFWQDHLVIITTFLTLVTTTIAISR